MYKELSVDNTSQHFAIAKEPNIGTEDACYSKPEFGLIAIADGLSNGSTLTYYWADLLVKNFCELNKLKPCEYIRNHTEDWLQPLQKQWKKQYSSTISQLKQSNQNAWIPLVTPQAQRKAKGAATFAALQAMPFDEGKPGKWEAIAVGDSCVFQFRQTDENIELISRFPLMKSEEFSSKTGGITSRPDMSIVGGLIYATGEYHVGDIFITATDALSEWLLRNYEEGKEDWKNLLLIQEDAEFKEMVSDLLQKKEIVFDDTTFCRMKIFVSPKARPIEENELEPVNSQEQLGINETRSTCELKSKSIKAETLLRINHRLGEPINKIISAYRGKICEAQKIITTTPCKKRKIFIPNWVKNLSGLIVITIVVLVLIYYPFGSVLTSKVNDLSRKLIRVLNNHHP